MIPRLPHDEVESAAVPADLDIHVVMATTASSHKTKA